MHNVGELLTMPALPKSPVAPMMERVCEIAVLPHVIFSILEPGTGIEPGICDLNKTVSADPGLAAKVLVLANSGAFGKERQVFAIDEAIQIIGYRTLRTLAMTAGTFEMFVGKNDPNSLRRRRWWRHSLDAASCARWIAREGKSGDEDRFYSSALLHLLGKSLLDRYGGADYTLVTERQASGERDWDAESAVYGCSHIDLLVSLGEQWRLPTEMIEGFKYNREPDPSRGHAPLRACLAIATRLASALSRGKELGSGDIADCPQWALSIAGVTRDRLRFILDEGTGAIAVSQ